VDYRDGVFGYGGVGGGGGIGSVIFYNEGPKLGSSFFFDPPPEQQITSSSRELRITVS